LAGLADGIPEGAMQIGFERRAYEQWERAGRPSGWDKEFYRLAEEELRHQKLSMH
jgi:hypothetical protein